MLEVSRLAWSVRRGWFGRGAEELYRGVCGVWWYKDWLEESRAGKVEGRSEVKRTHKDFIVQEVEERQRAARGAASPIQNTP